MKDAVSRLKAWNERNPEMPIRIAPRQIGERVKAMAMSREQRFAKSVPKEMRGMRLRKKPGRPGIHPLGVLLDFQPAR